MKDQAPGYRFGQWLVEPDLDQIRRGDDVVRLEPLSMNVLVYLLEHADEVVSSDALLSAFWPRRVEVVEESTIHKRISEIRRVLGDDSRHPTYIETIAKRGYRAIARIEPIRDTRDRASTEAEGSPAETVPDASLTPVSQSTVAVDKKPTWPRYTGLGLIVVALIGVAGYLYLEPFTDGQSVAVDEAVDAATAIDSPRTFPLVPAFTPVIAVLPFVNMSSDPENDYFSEGISEQLLNDLAQLKGIKVIARTSSFQFASSDRDIADIRTQLGASHVLEGSVRKGIDRVRVTARLTRAADGTQLWSETYDRELTNVLAVQDELARAIVDVLQVEFSRGWIDGMPRRTDSIEAFDLYLKAAYRLSRSPDPYFGVENATLIDLLEGAIALDPNYADAYAFLSNVHMQSGFYGVSGKPADHYRLAETVNNKALELAPRHYAALANRICLAAFYHRDPHRAFRESDELLDLYPSDALARFYYAIVLLMYGKGDLGVHAVNAALELDPLQPVAQFNRVYTLGYAGRVQDAQRAFARLPTVVQASYPISLTLALQSGDHAAARELLDAHRTNWPPDQRAALEARLLVIEGKPVAARRVVEQLEAFGEKGYVPAASQGAAYAAIGDFEASLDWFERAVDDYDARINWYLPRNALYPLPDELAETQRFHDLLKRLRSDEETLNNLPLN